MREMNARIALDFTMNGRPERLETAPGKRALDLLREDLGLTAAKQGCGMGECGACAVLVDGVARLSCLMLAAQLEGREVVTAEGLGTVDAPHPIQASFAAAGAVQCGYCTPGMTVAVADLLARNPSPDQGEAREAVSGNLCRCTGYAKIVDAVMDAAEALRRRSAGESRSQEERGLTDVPARKDAP
jgi:carbon-monoxide dehydrogenase small subunit